ncbi:MAG: amino acid dehydrogenase [Planctomycetota bacterium]|nr:amino acid dehydrogenase [Planctomycetota bacterium]
MPLFKVLDECNCQSLTFVSDAASGLNALVALHNTRRGPAFGGIRTLSYQSQSAAVTDAVRLAQAMSYKAAVADLPAGGGKCVVIKTDNMDRPAAFRALGRAIEQFGGRYFTGLDVGTTHDDLVEIAKETKYVAKDLDFGKATARGVMAAIKAALKHRFGSESFEGRSVAVQGLGAVGAELVTMLSAEGAELFVADADQKLAAEVGEKMECEVVNAARILSQQVDVLAPCALGSIFTAQNADSLRCQVIAGSANNQLATPAAGEALRKAGITFVPDYVANAGALIKGVSEYAQGHEVGFDVVDRIHATTTMVLERAAREDKPTNEVADAIARERLA